LTLTGVGLGSGTGGLAPRAIPSNEPPEGIGCATGSGADVRTGGRLGEAAAVRVSEGRNSIGRKVAGRASATRGSGDRDSCLCGSARAERGSAWRGTDATAVSGLPAAGGVDLCSATRGADGADATAVGAAGSGGTGRS